MVGGSYSDVLLTGISSGGISSSSNTALRDTTFVCIVNSATSLFSSITIFSVLEFKAHDNGVSIDDVSHIVKFVISWEGRG